MTSELIRLHDLIWTALPWEACVVVGLLCVQAVRRFSGSRVHPPHVLATITCLLLGLVVPTVLHVPEAWAWPLFATGASLAALATIRSRNGRRTPSDRLWTRLSRGVWCVAVGFYLIYGVGDGDIPLAANGGIRVLVLALAVLAALHFTMTLLPFRHGQRASPGAPIRSDAREPVRYAAYPGEPYPHDYPTISNTQGSSADGEVWRPFSRRR